MKIRALNLFFTVWRRCPTFSWWYGITYLYQFYLLGTVDIAALGSHECFERFLNLAWNQDCISSDQGETHHLPNHRPRLKKTFAFTLHYLFWFPLSSLLIRKIHLEHVSDILCALCVFRPLRFKVMEWNEKIKIIASCHELKLESDHFL